MKTSYINIYMLIYTGGRNDSMLLRDGEEELELFCYYMR